ncbi:MAG: hypothetical protein NTX50_19165 [Candidatus Sumerlaeota bacterium]|nr:hypothetical protein [Candidatus Sumerlaeota bacterium]
MAKNLWLATGQGDTRIEAILFGERETDDLHPIFEIACQAGIIIAA